ncbi:hypothetical protein [Stutzerimonas stutzeri]|uniref:hypothetical protein n=1 Tax=Stutzerimonas stutzeri TaxID=316 RepID=UPI0015E461FA|nr:hypothetical protein [Stutzerimonas stutzeri]MBA1280285.1 hypothetical protein [Stutzerimonas stutzeri]
MTQVKSMKKALLKALQRKQSLIALLVAVVAVSVTFVSGDLSNTQSVLLLTAWIGGAYTFLKTLFDAYFEQLNKCSKV